MDEPIFYFDFGSLNAYLAWRLLPEIEQRTGARFEQVPVLLGGIFKGDRQPLTRRGLCRRARQARLRVSRDRPFHRPPWPGRVQDEIPHFPVNTLALMRGAVAAGERWNWPRPM